MKTCSKCGGTGHRELSSGPCPECGGNNPQIDLQAENERLKAIITNVSQFCGDIFVDDGEELREVPTDDFARGRIDLAHKIDAIIKDEAIIIANEIEVQYIASLEEWAKENGELQDRIAALEAKNELERKKWEKYEQQYILPLFDKAKADGWSLEDVVRENPGKNCVELFVERIRPIPSYDGKQKDK
jgi:hypothetical protein